MPASTCNSPFNRRQWGRSRRVTDTDQLGRSTEKNSNTFTGPVSVAHHRLTLWLTTESCFVETEQEEVFPVGTTNNISGMVAERRRALIMRGQARASRPKTTCKNSCTHAAQSIALGTSRRFRGADGWQAGGLYRDERRRRRVRRLRLGSEAGFFLFVKKQFRHLRVFRSKFPSFLRTVLKHIVKLFSFFNGLVNKAIAFLL